MKRKGGLIFWVKGTLITAFIRSALIYRASANIFFNLCRRLNNLR